MGISTPSVRHSIGVTLLKRVFGFYCIAAIVITLLQGWGEFVQSKDRIALSIAEQQPLVEEGLASAVWHLDQPLIDSLISGVLSQGTVVGVAIYNPDGSSLAEIGQTHDVILEGNGPIVIPELEPSLYHHFHLRDPHASEATSIAEVVFFSSNSVAIEQVKSSLMMLVVAALLKTLILWSLFIYFGRMILSHPLNRLTRIVEKLPLDISADKSIADAALNELQLLERAILGMRDKLSQTLQELRAANEQLSRMNVHLQCAVEQSPTISTVLSMQGNVIYATPSFQQITGFLPTHTQTFFDSQVFTQFPLDSIVQMLESKEEPFVYQGELGIKTAEGSSCYLSVCFSPVEDEQGESLNILFSASDITSIKKLSLKLKETNSQQQEMIEQLENAQNQLRESEKMASVGQLAAGVAHEINNPIGFISSNAKSLESYLENFLSLLDSYSRLEASLPESDRKVISGIKDEFGYDFIREDVSELLADTREGIDRVTRIVRDLLSFSRSAETEFVYADVRDGLKSTLNVVWSELKYKVDVSMELEDIPQVCCVPSQLNQVFMNMMVNASHAIDVKGTLAIRTRSIGDEVLIEFEDNGSGIEADNVSKLFDPFFTTKPVGTGTGLGLSVSYGIIQKHHGRIEVVSEVGKGTCFSIWLPVQPSAVLPEAVTPDGRSETA